MVDVLEPAEAAFRVEHPGGTPAFDHLAVAPPLQQDRIVHIVERWAPLRA